MIIKEPKIAIEKVKKIRVTENRETTQVFKNSEYGKFIKLLQENKDE